MATGALRLRTVSLAQRVWCRTQFDERGSMPLRYSSYGFDKSLISLLFIVGFGASGLFGTFAGSLADKFGRKKFCLIFAVVCAHPPSRAEPNSLRRTLMPIPASGG